MFFPFRHVQVPLRQVEAPAVGWSLVVSIARAVRVDGVFYSWKLDVRDGHGVVRSQQALNLGGQFSSMRRSLSVPPAVAVVCGQQSFRGAVRAVQEHQPDSEADGDMGVAGNDGRRLHRCVPLLFC
jgi:hypothetical protein